MADFYSRLSCSFGNEDYRTEHQALNIQSGDRVLCITASGDRPLHLLLKECKEVMTIDANPHQSHLLELKKAAMQALDYERYSEFLGITRSKRRNELWNIIKDKLPRESREFWEGNKKMILKGVLYQGALERFCSFLSIFIRLVQGYKIKRLFQCDNLDQQKELLDSKWSAFLWNKAFDWALHPRITSLFVKEQELYTHLGSDIDPGKYVRERWKNCLSKTLAKNSILISLALKGKVDQNSLPPYLTRKGQAIISPRTSRLHIETADAISFLKRQNPGSIDVFSLSDIASYMPQQDFNTLLLEIQRTAKPGARFCLRQSLSDHFFPEKLTKYFSRDLDLEKRLESQDRCFVYRFFAGTVN